MINLVAWFAAALLSALAPALAGTLFVGSLRVLPMAFVLALLHSTLLGLPIALACRKLKRTSLAAASFAGFAVGALPTGYLAWPLDLSFTSSASVGGVPTRIGGIPTLAGWREYMELVAASGGLGALGGLIFWLVLTATGALRDARSVVPGDDRRSAFVSAGLAVAASVAAISIAAVPSITADRSCHNMFADGRRSIAPSMSVDLDVDVQEWPRVIELFGTLENTHQMSVRNSSRRDATVNVLSLSACTEDGVVFFVNQFRWASHLGVPQVPARGVQISIFEVTPKSRSNQFGQDLLALLNTEWPDKATLRTLRS